MHPLRLFTCLPIAWPRWRFPNPLLHNPIAARIEARTWQEQPVSGQRLGYLLAAVVLCFTLTGAVITLAVVAKPHLASYVSWLAPHFQ